MTTIATRRARSMAQLRGEMPELSDKSELTGRAFTDVRVLCTMSDIGDPRFRLWLAENLATRMLSSAGITLEIVA